MNSIITLDESIAIYASASRKWFGTEALEKTQERIEQLAKCGDFEGVQVFEKVKDLIGRLEQVERFPAHQPLMAAP
jgi:hypothetical protein